MVIFSTPMDTLGPILVGGHASSAIIAGHYAGLWTTLHGSPDKKWTFGDLAEAAGCKERWVREWCGVLSCAGVLQLSEGPLVSCSEEISGALLPDSELLCFYTCLEFTMDKEPKIGASFKKDGPLGCPYSDYPNFHPWMENWTRIKNKNTNYPQEFVDSVGPELRAALNKGIRVLEPGCGRGLHVKGMAEAFPNSTFIAFDIAEEVIAQNKEENKIYNIEYIVGDFCNMPQEWTSTFDYLMIFDCMHDLPHPAEAMKGLKRVLKEDGMVTMVDINTSTDMVKESKNPISAALYNISLHHCMSVSLAMEGVGLGACWGVEKALGMLKEHGEWREEEISVDLESIGANTPSLVELVRVHLTAAATLFKHLEASITE
eukprot:sb/3465765/